MTDDDGDDVESETERIAEENRNFTARLLLDESLRTREMQDQRIERIRTRSVALMALLGSVVTIVTGLADLRNDGVAAGVVAAIVVAAGFAFDVVRPRTSAESPNLEQFSASHFDAGVSPEFVLRDFALDLRDVYAKVESGTVAPIAKSFSFQLLAQVAAMVLLVAAIQV